MVRVIFKDMGVLFDEHNHTFMTGGVFSRSPSPFDQLFYFRQAFSSISRTLNFSLVIADHFYKS